MKCGRQDGGRFFSGSACLRQKFALRQFAGLVLAAALAGISDPAHAVQFTVDFDLVDVTTIAIEPDGSPLLAATAIGNGPFESRNGPGPVDFTETDVGEVVANYLSPRYFGSDAASIGSLIINLTNFKFVGGTNPFVPVPGVAIGAFEVQVAQPSTDSIVSVDGGNAFKHVSLSRDGKAVIFSDGDILNEFPPSLGETEELLWSGITPKAPQPPTSDVYLTTPTIPPNPTGEFAKMQLVGQAFAVPEPPTILLSLTGVLGLGVALRRRR